VAVSIRAAQGVYETIRKTGSQRDVIDTMQTREDLYRVLNYEAFEAKTDETLRGDS